MSKLREQLNASIFPVQLPILRTLNYWEIEPFIKQQTYDEQYSVDARIHMDMTIAKELLEDNPLIRERCIEKMKRAIIEEVFGEFRTPISEIEFAIYRGDLVKATKLLNALKEQMYG